MSGNTAMLNAETIRVEAPVEKQPRVRQKNKRIIDAKSKVFCEIKRVPGISVFAIIGTLIISVLMVFVVLAQVNYNEAASEAVRLSAHLRELTEMHRTLELAFESSIDIKEIERVARDELGMSRPDTAQIISITTTPRDTATVVVDDTGRGLQGFTDFIKSLTEYFRK